VSHYINNAPPTVFKTPSTFQILAFETELFTRDKDEQCVIFLLYIKTEITISTCLKFKINNETSLILKMVRHLFYFFLKSKAIPVTGHGGP
jgi:hypothetical protein